MSTSTLEPLAVGSEPVARRHTPVGESILRGALAMFSAQPLSWVATLGIATFAPRFLGSEALGEYTLAFTIMTLASTVLGMGIIDFLTRRVAQNPERARRDLGIALLLQLSTYAVGALGIGLILPRVAPTLVDGRLLALAMVCLVLLPPHNLLLSALRGYEQHARYAWMGASWSAAGSIGGVAALFAGADVMGFAATYVALSAAAMIVNWKVSGMRVTWPALDRELLGEAATFVRGGFPFVSWNVTLAIYGGIDRVLLGFFVPASELGWYAAAYRIIGITVFIPTLLTTPLFPVISRAVGEPEVLKRSIAHTIRIGLLFTVPISAGIIVAAPAIPTLLNWPADFDNAVPLMMILSLHLPVVSVDMLLGTVVMAIGREGRWVRVGLLAAVFNVAGNFVGIPFFEQMFHNGAVGASIVTVLTEILMFFGAAMLLPKHLLDRDSLWQAARMLLAGGAMVAVGLLLMQVSVFVALPVAGLSFLGAAVALRALSMEDVRYVQTRLRRRSKVVEALA